MMGKDPLKKILQDNEIEGVIFFSPENIRYHSGFSGGEGALLVKDAERLLFVDPRYTTQAQEEVHHCRVMLIEKGIRELASHLSGLGVRRLGVEASGISLAAFKELEVAANGVQLIPIKDEIDRLRGIKREEEIMYIRKAISTAERALEEVLPLVTPGVKEVELAAELEYRMKKMGGEKPPFDCIVASGPRSALPHAQPAHRQIESGDLLLFDFGSRCGGYCSDETVTFVFGSCTEEHRRIYGIVKDAHDRAIEKVRPGIPLAEIDALARGIIDRAGYAPHFGHGTGHGIGLCVHEWPAVRKESNDIAQEGMVFTIEPGIYIPGWGGVRIEDMVLVTSAGHEVLTKISKELMILA